MAVCGFRNAQYKQLYQHYGITRQPNQLYHVSAVSVTQGCFPFEPAFETTRGMRRLGDAHLGALPQCLSGVLKERIIFEATHPILHLLK
jgi:hypothetical protein